MKEIKVIVEEYDRLKAKGIRGVLATVVHVEGSSYRRAGARMLVDARGHITGAISGGCLEGDALKKALLALEQGRSKLVTYDTLDEDDAVIGAQLGCNGVIQVLFEPIDPDHSLNPCELLRWVAVQEVPTVLGVYFDLRKSKPQRGTLWAATAARHLGTTAPGGELLQILERGQSGFYELKGSEDGTAFLQYVLPSPHLVVVGAGNDALVLSRQAVLLGWKVTVVDGRSTHATSERFGSLCQVVVSRPEEALNGIGLSPRTCFVLMSHNYQYDLSVLKGLRTRIPITYIGILGPRKKFLRMKEELGSELTKEMESAIYAPVGLELGAETPEEIGLSVLAEIQAVLNGSPAGHLRDKAGPIHDGETHRFKKVK